MHFSESGKSEVSNLQVHRLINKDVLKFEVSVNNSFSMHIMKDVHHLGQEKAATILTHSSEFLADIKEQTTRHEFEKDINEIINFSTRWLLNLSIWAVTNNLYDILVFEALKDLNFAFYRFDGVLISLQELFSEELEGNDLSRIF